MNNEDDVVKKFEAVISAKKDGSVEIKPKEDHGPALKLTELPRDSKELATIAKASGGDGFYCINNEWHWCIFIAGAWICWPLGAPC